MTNYSDVDSELKGVLSQEVPQEPVADTTAPRMSWWRRLWGQTAAEEKFVVSQKWATEVVKSTSWPLERYAHPAWALSFEEASRAAPEMQTFLQAVVDRYLPALMKRFVSKHSALLDMLAALGIVYAAKYKAIRLQIEAERPGKPVSVPTPIKKEEAAATVEGEIAHPETATGPESVTCETCGGSFKNALEAAGHLPCKGRIQ